MVVANNEIDSDKKYTSNAGNFWWPCRYGGAMQGTLPYGTHPWLHAKPLDATIRQVPMRYRPGGRHGRRFRMKQKNTNKRQLLPSFLMVDRHKKAKQFRDPKLTLYSSHWCNKLRTNVKHHCSSWRAKLHFELVVSHLDMYHTKVLMYRTMVLMARLTKVRR